MNPTCIQCKRAIESKEITEAERDLPWVCSSECMLAFGLTGKVEDLHVCNDYGDNPACLKTVDERFTMRFDDLGAEPIYWCGHCGPEAKAMIAVLEHACEERGPEFVAELEAEISNAERTRN